METILLPSPNWFHVAILAVSKDGWVVYGGPNKSLCVLEPLQKNKDLTIDDDQCYKAHVVLKAHPEKIVSVDISPDWARKRCFIAGSTDGSVKQWALEGSGKDIKVKPVQSHDFHYLEKEDVAGVGYSLGSFAITVGSYGNIVKWDLQSNVVKSNAHFLKNFRPVCMACSPHVPLCAAVGTKQGVIFVLDFSGPGKVMYKVRGQDEEIVNISWCPMLKVTIKKTYKESPGEDTLSFTSDFDTTDIEVADKVDNVENKGAQSVAAANPLEASGVIKNLPDDSFDDAVVVEEDLFDKYKDHEADEFGHKKYEPEEIVVKIKEKAPEGDYLSECLKLKEDILQKKKQEEQTIHSLVEAMDKTHVDSEKEPGTSKSKVTQVRKSQTVWKTTTFGHKHMLASVGKFGGVRIWSRTGKLVANCAVPVNSSKAHRSKAPNWPTLLWYKPNCLLVADGKSDLLEINPLVIDAKNKLEWKHVHSLHKRGLYCIASQAPRIQGPTEAHWPVWTVSQDRNLIKFDMKTKNPIATYGSCGGYIYKIEACPYDAGKIAVSVGDGAVRVWQTDTLENDDSKLGPGKLTTHWQNVQGKVLKLAWHPIRENMLAFSTAEARVGIIDTSGKNEKPAKALLPALRGGVYSLCWGDGFNLYACGGGELVIYQADKKDQFPTHVNVVVEGQRWDLSEVQWRARGLVVGSGTGAVAVLSAATPHTLLAVAFPFTKMIYTIDWHPQQISTSNEESPFKNLIAVCSLDKQGDIVILEFCDNEDTKELKKLKTLSAHKAPVHDITWSPHRDAQLLSSSADGTYKVWDVAEGVVSHVLVGPCASALCATWSSFPAQAHAVLTGGSDYSLRLWDIRNYPAEAFDDSQYPQLLLKKDKKKLKDKREMRKKEEYIVEPEEQIAATLDTKVKSSRKYLLPTISRQMNNGKIDGARRVFKNYMAKQEGRVYVPGAHDKQEYDLEYLKIFGSMKDVNDVLDNEMERHLETGNLEPWIILSIFRGHIEDMIQFASQRDMLCPYLLSIAPCVSFKYWKDATQLYLTQIDRLVARGEEERLSENRTYGGPVFRKVATLLSVHDVRGAVAALMDARLYREAYLLCRIRFMDSIAEETLQQWAEAVDYAGNTIQAAVCYLVLGNLKQAVITLSKTNIPDCLALAADLAKVTGQTLFADHIEKKVQIEKLQISANSGTDDTTEDTLQELPLRVELFLVAGNNEGDSESVTNEDSGLDE
ncbi:gem-associated protein 5 isoform X2 [Manduca sexta]|uniref:gem-associated protein 5 isoform X2 n=1 Tax=Manduca sexta TaxID=7130 RepID=UPI001182A90A|nr:gem-associated protein 5 isoform X2 [Manduca sexta]